MHALGFRRLTAALGLAVLLPLAASCAPFTSSRTDSPRRAYVTEEDGTLLARHAPLFVLQTYARNYNRIGAPTARLDDAGQERIRIDTKRPAVYAQQEPFRTERGAYTNLIYRVHFPGIPFPRLASGSNVGLIVIVTLDSRQRPVLITTVRANGHGLAFVPTTFLPKGSRPKGWRVDHGAGLPGLLQVPDPYSEPYRPAVFLRDETHAVADVRVQDVREASWRYAVIPAKLRPMAALENLPLGKEETTSLFYEHGLRRGYAKGSGRPLQTLLMSWWTMDLFVGSDKLYGEAYETGNVFYTSLRFWRRRDSDMWPFAEFLRFWGWRL